MVLNSTPRILQSIYLTPLQQISMEPNATNRSDLATRTSNPTPHQFYIQKKGPPHPFSPLIVFKNPQAPFSYAFKPWRNPNYGNDKSQTSPKTSSRDGA